MAAEILRFDDFELDRGTYELRRAGQVLHLERIPLELLFLLIERRGQLVTRGEIIERIWGKGVFIDSDNAINGAVRKLRRALSDNSDQPRFIAVIHGRGYRFAAPIREAAATSALVRPTSSRLVGREREIAEMAAGLEAAVSGHGGLLLVSGGPGIGKTRLAQELAAQAQSNRMTVMVGRCSEHVEAVPFLPFVEILESCVDAAASPDLLDGLFGTEGPDLARLLPKLKRIRPDLPPPLELPPEQARRHLLNCFCGFAGRMAGQQPALMILDDLHWADDSTLALLGHLARRLANLPLMVVGTYRDIELDVNGAFARTLEELIRGRLATVIRLKELNRDEVAQMLAALGRQAPPAAIVSEFYQETAGNPFFVEELFRYLAEENRLYDAQGVFRAELRIGELEVPQSVRLVIGRRLARLSEPTRRMLETAAVIGRTFSLGLVEAATTTRRLAGCSEEAERAALIFSNPDNRQLDFSHELVRQVVISALAPARREMLHERVGQALESMFAGQLDDHVNQLAYHYARSNNTEKAVLYFTSAGESAMRRFAYREAEAHFRSALRMVEKSTSTQVHDERQLKALQGLDGALRAIHGIGFGEVGGILNRIGELCRRFGWDGPLVETLYLEAQHHSYVGDMDKAVERCTQALDIAGRINDPAKIALSRNGLGIVHFWTGMFAASRLELEPTLAPDSPSSNDHPDNLVLASVVAIMLSRDLWMLGFPDQSRQRRRQSIQLAARLNDPLVLAQSRAFGADVNYYCGEVQEVDQRTIEVRNFLAKTDSGIPQLIGWTAMLEGWVKAQSGHVDEALIRIRNGFSIILASGNRVALPLFGCLLANAQAAAAQPIEALATLDQTLKAAQETGQHYSDSELCRLRGEFLLMRGNRNAHQAEECFRKARLIARRQQAKSWELRAAMSLARLLDQQGKRKAARKTLAEIYNWFTEGFDTADLKEAKTLLDQLSR